MQQDKRMMVGYFVVAVIAVILLLGTCVYQGVKDLKGPPPNSEALAREQTLLQLARTGIGVPGATFVGESSDPGREGGQTFTGDERDVTVTRAYRVSDPEAACLRIAAHLNAAGWDTKRESCETGSSPAATSLSVEMRLRCREFLVHQHVTVWLATANSQIERGDVRVLLRSGYPGEGYGRQNVTGLIDRCAATPS